jgi:chemotaxis protein MotD
MVDIAIQNAPSGLDALTASRSQRNGRQDDGDRGFLHAMSGSQRDRRQPTASARGDDAKADAGADGDPSESSSTDTAGATAMKTDQNAAAQTPVASNGATAPSDGKAPKIPPGLKAPQLPTSFPKSLLGLQKAALVDPPQATDLAAPTPIDAVPEAAAGGNPADDLVQQLSVPIAADPAGQAADGAAEAIDPSKPVKAADDTDGKATATPAVDPGAVSDVLSLLNVAPATVVPVAAQTVAAAFAADDAQAAATTEPEPPLSRVASGARPDVADEPSAPTPQTATDGTAPTFKFVRANGRSGSMDASIGKAGDDAAQFDVKASAGTVGDTVTVLDSRRFLGLADGSNSAIVAGALSGDKEWAAAMRSNAALSNPDPVSNTGKVVNTLKIQMNPIDLGLVTAHMRLSGDQLSVDLKVQSAEAYRQLSSDQGKMMDALRAQGYAVDRITVSMAPAASEAGDKQGQPGFQGQQSQQQSPMSHGQGSEAQAKRQGYSGQQTNGNDSGRSSKDVAVEDGLSGGAQRSRSGSVYL